MAEALRIHDVDFGDAAFLVRPWEEIGRLLEADPIYRSERQGGWIVSRREDVKAAFADRRLSAARVSQLSRMFDDTVRERIAEAIGLRQPAFRGNHTTDAAGFR